MYKYLDAILPKNGNLGKDRHGINLGIMYTIETFLSNDIKDLNALRALHSKELFTNESLDNLRRIVACAADSHSDDIYTNYSIALKELSKKQLFNCIHWGGVTLKDVDVLLRCDDEERLVCLMLDKLFELHDKKEFNKIYVYDDFVMFYCAMSIWGEDKVTFITSNEILANSINRTNVHYINHTQKLDNILTELRGIMIKPELIIGNPPYSVKSGGNSNNLWRGITDASIDALESNGVLMFIHPSGWRSGGKKTTKLFDKLVKNNQMEYLEMHNIDDGIKTFNATTNYDWYLVKKTPQHKATPVKYVDRLKDDINFAHLNYLPSFNVPVINSLMAKNGEEKVEVSHSYSFYETRNDNVSKTKHGEFVNECAYMITPSGEITSYYSNDDVGHFGVPKVMVQYGNGTSSVIDGNGDYGMTEYVFGIIDDVENLPSIKRALDSDDFKNVIKGMQSSTSKTFNLKIFKDFRKDFWKDFI